MAKQRIAISHLRIPHTTYTLVFVSPFWCHYIKCRYGISKSSIKWADIVQCIHSVLHSSEGKKAALFFCFARKVRTSDELLAWFLSDWTWLCASPFLSSLQGNLHPPHIYNSLQGWSSTPACQTIQMRHQRSPFSSTLLATIFTVHSVWPTRRRGSLAWRQTGTKQPCS